MSDRRPTKRSRISVALSAKVRLDLENLVDTGWYASLSDAVRAVLENRRIPRGNRDASDRANALRLLHFTAQTLHHLYVEVEPQLESPEAAHQVAMQMAEIVQILRSAAARSGIGGEQERNDAH